MNTNKFSRELAFLAQFVPAHRRLEFMQLASKMPSISALKNSKEYKDMTKETKPS